MPTSPIILSGRPRSRVPLVKWKITVPADVAVLVEEALPGRDGKTKYGARAELIEQLLRRWLIESDIKGGFDSPSQPPKGEASGKGTDTSRNDSAVPPIPSPPPPFSDEGI